MSDPILDAVRAGAEPSDMRQLTERVWLSVDERYLVVCLAASNYQCFERHASGWLPADRPCQHVGKVLEGITGRKRDPHLPQDHGSWKPLSQSSAYGIDGVSTRDAPADEHYDPEGEEEARQWLARADLHLQALNPVLLEPARRGRSVKRVRQIELRAAQRAAIKALLVMNDLEDLYS